MADIVRSLSMPVAGALVQLLQPCHHFREDPDLSIVLRRHQADVAHVSCCQPLHAPERVFVQVKYSS